MLDEADHIHVLWPTACAAGCALLLLLAAWVLFVRDVRRRRAALEEEIRRRTAALAASERKFATVFEHAPAMMTISAVEDGRYIDVNDSFLRVCGFTRDEVLGKTSTELGWITPADRDRLLRTLREQGVVEGMELRLTARNRREVWVLYNGDLITIDHDLFLLSHAVDITARRCAEAERARLEARLAKSQRMESIGRLAGGVAHDFNNMLSVIIGRAEVALYRIPPEDPLRTDLLEIRKAALRSADLTRQMLAFARRQPAAPKVIDLNDTLGAMIGMLRRLVGESVSLTWAPAPDLWRVRMDPAQVDQIVVHLVANARDALRGSGSVTLATANRPASDRAATDRPALPGDGVVLSVSDTGPGMDAAALDHLFEPFSAPGDSLKGTGLALSTVQGIVEQNGGIIEVQSEPGRGAIFRVCLPRAFGDGAAPAPESAPRPAAGRGVLLVEDSESLLALCQSALSGLGYVVFPASCPNTAVEIFHRNADRIDLLVTDVIMPGMNGQELYNRLRAAHPALKCLYMSGYSADVIDRSGILLDGVHFLQKPFSTAALADHAAAVLREPDSSSAGAAR
jgi:PAS domain S-box-containing protein